MSSKEYPIAFEFGTDSQTKFRAVPVRDFSPKLTAAKTDFEPDTERIAFCNRTSSL